MRVYWMNLLDDVQATMEAQFESIYESQGISMTSVDKSTYAFRVGNDSSACVDWTRYTSLDPSDPDFGTLEVLTDIPDSDICQLFCGYDSRCLAYEYNAANFNCALIYTQIESMVASNTTECYFKTTIPVDIDDFDYCPCGPSISPTSYPSPLPVETTAIPSALPSTSTARVVAQIFVKDATPGLSDDELDALSSTFMDVFELSQYDELLVQYESSVAIDLSCEVTASIASAVERAVAQALDIHVKDTDVTITSSDSVVISIRSPTYDDAVSTRNSKARESFKSEVARYVPHFTSHQCSTNDIAVQAAVAAKIDLAADLGNFKDLEAKGETFKSQIPFASDDVDVTFPSPDFFPSNAPVASPTPVPTIAPSTSPSMQPSKSPTTAPTQTNKVFSPIWVVDADSSICGGQADCANRARIVSFMQNVTDSVMLEYNEMMMFTYDSLGTLRYHGIDDPIETYIQALDDNYVLERSFSEISAGLSIFMSEIGVKEFNENHNYITFFLTEGYEARDNPSIYKNFMPAEPEIPMVVIAISQNLDDVDSQFLVWTRRHHTFFGFDKIDDLNSQTVLDRLYSDEVVFDNLLPRLD